MFHSDFFTFVPHFPTAYSDINMPTVGIYGTQQPFALVKLLIDRGVFYGRGSALNLKQVQKKSYIAAMDPPGGAISALDTLFISLFNVIHVT